MLDAILIDPLLDSLKVFAVVFIFHLILSFCENKVVHVLTKHQAVSPLLGASLGLIPQCGISIIAADMFIKRHISVGTIVAVFIACSDEALPLLFTSQKGLMTILPLLLIKLVLGFAVGYLTDFILVKGLKKQYVEANDQEIDAHHIGCCHHEIEEEKESSWKEHLFHPLIHSLKIFLYVLIINIIFGTIIYFVTEERLLSFLSSAKYLAPLLSIIVGLIPNCASSVVLTKLYLLDGLGFGALLGGLMVNAGLGILYILKSKDGRKHILLILGILIFAALIASYLTTFIYN